MDNGTAAAEPDTKPQLRMRGEFRRAGGARQPVTGVHGPRPGLNASRIGEQLPGGHHEPIRPSDQPAMRSHREDPEPEADSTADLKEPGQTLPSTFGGTGVSPGGMPAFQHEGTKASIALRRVGGLSNGSCLAQSLLEPRGYEDMGSISEVHVIRRLKLGAS